MTTHVLFDSDDIVVHYQEGSREFILVTFIGIGHEANAGATYFGKPVVEADNIACLGVTTRKRNWYYSNNMHTALRVMQRVMAEYEKTVTIGLSAGAYAAIKYAGMLGSERTLALGPQWTIDDQEGEVIPEWAALCEPSMRGMGVKPGDLHGEIYALFDRHHRSDTATVGRLLDYATGHERAQLLPVNVPSAGHIVFESLKGSNNLRELIAILVSKDEATICADNLRRATSRMRRSNTTNLYNRIANGYTRFPKLVYDMLVSQGFRERFNYRDVLRDETLLFRICAQLGRNGYMAQAQILLRSLISYYATGEFRPGGADHLVMGTPVMLDHRGRTLGYSSRHRHFTSSNIVWMEGDATPVSLVHIDHKAYPCVTICGRKFFLDREGDQIRALASPGGLHAECRGATCGIRDVEDRYLTVVGDREMTWSTQQHSFETFSVVTV
ncbi:hypothetical protein [Asaia krungthepensis]|uniref:Alpha/beta hydrolase n=1 Tax=Asaia krungthepensis NRIC 0535 TaxID=1307925 RepID=A0ABQ0Q6E6_9PROT|nr:hypothetical protein [Asaia krungthepensis]GBQ93513.1 hypothetical protein AA0535_2852 [Asaia krungthepensis NRIC 0535]